MVLQNAIHIAPGVQRGQLRRAELFPDHHAAKAADGFIVERVFENLPHFFKKSILCNLGENGNILCNILHMNVDLIGIGLILCCGGFHDGIKNSLLAGEVIVKRWRFDANGLGNLSHTDRIVSLRRKEFQRFIQYFLLGIFLPHLFTTL